MIHKQSKSEGFDSCDQPSNFAWNWIQIIDFSVHVTFKFDGWPKKNNRAPLLYYVKLCASFQTHWWIQTAVTVQKRSIWVKIGDFLSCVTLKFDGWPWQTIGHLFYATSSFVNHFKAISEFKLEWQSANTQFHSKSAIFVPCDLEIFMMTSSNGNIFRVTDHLCGKFTGPRWISRTKASDAELWCFLWFTPE